MNRDDPMEHRNEGKASNSLNSVLTRRKVRKGTSSCWECRHRKKRCDFGPGSTVCVFCVSHRLECVSQEFSESTNTYKKVEQRIDRVEGLVKQLVQQRKRKSTITPESSTTLEQSQCVQYPTLCSVNHERVSRGRSLTGYLFSILPGPDLSRMILKSSKLFRAPLQIAQGQQPSTAEACPDHPEILPTAHPILFARRLIQLALCLQHSDAKSAEQLKLQLRRPVNDVAQRYFAAACQLVMSQDFLISSIDGLHTLVLQGRYHLTIGDPRTAWLIQRRAANIAHGMGFPQLAETIGGRAKLVWFELIYSDRFLSLMLGLPLAISDNEAFIPQYANITPAQTLERVHVSVAGRMIARNMRMQQRKGRIHDEASIQQDYQETKMLDQQLKKATRLMPNAWWLVPSLDKTSSDFEVAERTARLLVQMHQFYLLVLLHQPYVIEHLEGDYQKHSVDPFSPDYMYSKLAAVSASREVIARYLVLRNYHRSPSSRAMDDKGFTASINLLLTHLDGHCLGNANVLEHQRSHDLGMIETVANLIEDLRASNEHSFDVSQAQVLKRFINIEADAADGSSYHTRKGEGNDSGRSDGLELSIPYIGVLHITRQQEQSSVGMETTDLNYVKMSEIFPEVLIPRGTTSSSRNLDDSTSAMRERLPQEVDTSWLDS
ncbi:hypothetical protein N7523_004963 [Penicillium sp. IBT 18751x]|nr:hypothetical protein N7523_004963 [Penicillium sp. IBT 18751x]